MPPVSAATVDDLRRLTNEMVDTILDLIAGCSDEDVTFVPEDPDAYDPVAPVEDEIYLPWTLGHVIVHTTATGEESAAEASELARGVKHHDRSRSEVPWRTITTVAQCRHRLEESRRMRLASFDMWPDQPHLDNIFKPFDDVEPFNATALVLLSLGHDQGHLEQIDRLAHRVHT